MQATPLGFSMYSNNNLAAFNVNTLVLPEPGPAFIIV